MKKFKHLLLIAILLISFSGCYNKQTNSNENYKELGQTYGTIISQRFPKLEESKYLVSCLSYVDASNIEDKSDETITFIVNECTKEIRKIANKSK